MKEEEGAVKRRVPVRQSPEEHIGVSKLLVLGRLCFTAAAILWASGLIWWHSDQDGLLSVGWFGLTLE